MRWPVLVLAAANLTHQPPTPGATTMPSTKPVEALEARHHLAADTYDWKPATIKGNGFIDGIVYSPAEPGLVYIHTDMGGAYRYDASRSRWVPSTDFAKYTDPAGKSMGVETLAVDPTDPDRVYLGLGTYMQNSAVLRSSDRGQTWQRTDVPFQMNGNGSARNTGERMMVDPNAPNILFYGTRDDGLFKSTDRAATWTKVNTFPTIGLDSGWGQDTGILFVVFDKSSSTPGNATKNIYVGVFDPTAGVPRIYRSSDAGATWAALPGGQPTAANLFPQRAALSPDGTALYITYATSTSYPGPYGVGDGNVVKVTNPAGAAPGWTDISPPVNYAFSAVTLDPTNANTLYVSELGNYNPADRIWRSTNGGASWSVITPNSHRDDSSAPYAAASKVHWMGDLQIDPSNRDIAMFTTGYGLYRTVNLTAAEPNWTFFNEGFEQSAVLELASPAGGPVSLFSAIGDRDGFRHVDFSVSPAAGLFGQNNGMARGTSPDIDVAGNDPNYLVRTVQTSPYVQVSRDNGVTWTWLSSAGITGGDNGHVAISGDGTRVIYEPGGNRNQLLLATRTGNTWSGWTAPSSGRPADGSRILVDAVDGMTFYANAGRTVSRSSDGGANWTVMTTAAPDGVNWIRAVPGNAGHLVAACGTNGVYRSTDGGATWTRLSTSVSDAYAIGVGAAAPGKTYPSIYIAGSANGTTGFSRSDDEGATWVSISDAEHQFGYVTVIQGDPRVFGRLYVGTNGRGIQVGEPLKVPTTLPTGWRRDDIGSPALAGQSGAIGDTFTLAGSGGGVAGTADDQFHFASTDVGGDGSVVARVEHVAETATTAQAGVMIRADNSPGSAFALASVLSNGKVTFAYRVADGSGISTSAAVGDYASAKYVRLVRTGDTIVASYSTDGLNWKSIGAATNLALPRTARVGLAASSGGAALAKASFTNVAIVGDAVSPFVTQSDFDFRTTPTTLRIRFSEDVSSSLDASDLLLTRETSPSVSPTTVTFDPQTFEATFTLPAVLEAGDYSAQVVDGSITDRAGNALVRPAPIPFFHLPGDIDRDRRVGFSDLVILAQHYGQTNTKFEAGDLDSDQRVGFGDLVILARNYGATLEATISAATSTSVVETITPPRARKRPDLDL